MTDSSCVLVRLRILCASFLLVVRSEANVEMLTRRVTDDRDHLHEACEAEGGRMIPVTTMVTHDDLWEVVM